MSKLTAQNLDIDLPVPQDEVKATMERIDLVLVQIRKSEETVMALARMVQDGCDHPETIQRNPMGRWRFNKCTTCGKEW